MYRQVIEKILEDMQAGKYTPGQKLPSENALARRFETSRITIGRALRELKQGGLIAGVAGSGNFVKASAALEGLLFGLLIPNLGETEIFEPICQGMAAASEAGAYALLWGQASQEASINEQAIQLCRQYIARKVGGVFFAPVEGGVRSSEVNAQICSNLEAAHIPVILLDRHIEPFPARSRYDLVGIDNRRAGYIAAEHLLQLGCKDAAFLAIAGSATTVEARIAGYREALIANGVALEEKRIQRLNEVSEATVQRALEASGSRAFVCANDRVAGLFLQALQALGLLVPQDVRVVGIDDVDYARLLPVPLTTVRQPCRAIGEAAIHAMLTRRDRPTMLAREILLDCQLVVRQSSGARVPG